MSNEQNSALLKFAKIAGTVFVLAHFAAVGINTFAGSNAIRMGDDYLPIGSPKFAESGKSIVSPYLRAIRQVHDYRFPMLFPDVIACKCEIRLVDKDGKPLGSVDLPSAEAPESIQVRQRLLAQKLWRNSPVEEQRGVLVRAPSKKPMIPYWKEREDGSMILSEIAQNLVLYNQNNYERPSDSSITLAKSYAQHAAKERQAASAEVVRIAKRTSWPIVLTASVDELNEHFGDLPPCSFGVTRAE